MEIRMLQYFLAVAEEENITNAAKKLHMTQPSLSRQMMDLEKELGKKLFVRTNKKTLLTEDGLHLKGRAREILTLVEKTVRNKVFSKFVCSFLASILAFASVKCGLAPAIDKIIIGNIMSLIPGIGFTNALRDLFTGDNVAGVVRSIEAVLMALAIGAGYFVFVCVTGGL